MSKEQWTRSPTICDANIMPIQGGWDLGPGWASFSVSVRHPDITSVFQASLKPGDHVSFWHFTNTVRHCGAAMYHAFGVATTTHQVQFNRGTAPRTRTQSVCPAGLCSRDNCKSSKFGEKIYVTVAIRSGKFFLVWMHLRVFVLLCILRQKCYDFALEISTIPSQFALVCKTSVSVTASQTRARLSLLLPRGTKLFLSEHSTVVPAQFECGYFDFEIIYMCAQH